MLVKENIAIGRKMMAAVNAQDLSALDKLLVPDYINQQLEIRNREDLKDILRRQFQGLPDVHRELLHIIADEENVWIHVKITGTHTGEYRGIAPTGKKIVMPAVPSYRIRNGKIVEGWSVWNPLDLFKQLGVIEYKGFPDEIKQSL
ncbi:MAG: ester cyclase [Candidatus Ranarchaeia archaeon]|jgi:predicted ester cyclase